MQTINVLYRYSSQKYNKLLLEKGSVRIGTLYDYRSEEHVSGISDRREGTKTIYHGFLNWRLSEEVPGQPSKDFKALVAMGIINPDNPIGGVSNLVIEREFSDRNCYIHCTSMVLGRHVMEQFEGADSCVMISPKRFYRNLTRAINRIIEVEPPIHIIVDYQPREQCFAEDDMGLSGTSIKDPSYAGQYEFRTIWYPKSETELKPIILAEPSLVHYCRAIDIP